MKIIGHRGASADAPENTLESIQLAWEQGAFAAECDIIRTTCGKLVLMHDDSTKRTALNGEDLLVEDAEWHDLKDLDVGSWKDRKWQGVKIPLLEEVLRAIPEGKHLYIEIKSGNSNLGADERVIDDLEELMVKEAIAPEKITFICFDHDFINRIKKRLPDYAAFYVTSYTFCPGAWPYVKNIEDLESYIDAARANGIDGLDLESSPAINREWVEKIHQAGLKVIIWSFEKDDTLKNARRYQEMGVDFFTTNTPGKMLAALAPHPSAETPNSSNGSDDLDGSDGEEDYLQDGQLTQKGIDYLLRFKRFNLFNRTSTALLFTLCLPFTIPLAIFRLLALITVFGGGICLKKYLGISLESYPRIINLIYFICLGVYVRVQGESSEPSGVHSGAADDRYGSSSVIVTNHPSRFDALLLANLYQADCTYRAAARVSFFGKLMIASGLCSRTMEDGLALDIKEERDEFRQRLKKGHSRPMLFFPEGRVVQVPKTIMSFQTHLLQGQRVKVVCMESSYRSYFVDHTQVQMPFFREPYASIKNKVLWDSLSEAFPFLISLITVFETKVIGTVELTGSESQEEIDVSLYAPYFDNDFSLVDVDPDLAKKLLNSLYL